jgi:hypothetical protein
MSKITSQEELERALKAIIPENSIVLFQPEQDEDLVALAKSLDEMKDIFDRFKTVALACPRGIKITVVEKPT